MALHIECRFNKNSLLQRYFLLGHTCIPLYTIVLQAVNKTRSYELLWFKANEI